MDDNVKNMEHSAAPGWKSTLGDNMGNIIIAYTLIVMPVIHFYKEAVLQSMIFSALYGVMYVTFALAVVTYFAVCRPGLGKWELWVSLFLLLYSSQILYLLACQ